MGEKAIIRKGDPTSHGGTVLEGFIDNISMGKPMAGAGHMVHCPQCKGDYPIIGGPVFFQIMGVAIAVEGMKTSCGATLIATQQHDFVEAGSPAPSSSSGSSGGSPSALATTAAAATTASANATPASTTSGAPSRPAVNSDSEDTDLEHYFEVIDASGAPVNLTYRIDSKGAKLNEDRLSSNGMTATYPVETDIDVIFWKAPT